LTTSVYVSYSRKAETDSHIVDKLQAVWKARGIGLLDLKIDRQEINYGDSIRAFMDELSKADSVILVLSESYFKSRYCMYELRGIYAQQDFRKRVSPIILRGTPLYEPVAWVKWVRHWEEKEAELDAELKTIRGTNVQSIQSTLNDYAEFRQLLMSQLSILSDMNALTQDIHIDTDFEALLDRIQPKPSESNPKPRWHRKRDSEFLRIVRSEIKHILDRRINFEKALRAKVSEELSMTSGDLVEAICQADFKIVTSKVLSPATKSCLAELSTNSTERKETWEDAKSLLAWLSLLLVSPEWMAQQENNGMALGFSFEIMVKTPIAVEIISCRYRQMQPKFRAKQSKKDVIGEGRIEFPMLETGWTDELALNKLLLEIWLRIFPEEDKRQSLSADDLEALNETLGYYEQTKDYHYYVPVEESIDSPLARLDFRMKLLEKLPAITLIYLKAPSGQPSLLINEQSITTAIRGFFTSPWAY
jgi:hypothetical protein